MLFSRIKITIERNIFSRRLQWEDTHAIKVAALGYKLLVGNEHVPDDHIERVCQQDTPLTQCYDPRRKCIKHNRHMCWWCKHDIRKPLALMYARMHIQRFDETAKDAKLRITQE